MSIEKPAPWQGASGTEYVFEVFGPEPDVPARNGVYIYARRNESAAWVPLYMGAGDLAVRCTDPSVRESIAAKEPTHIHLRLMSREEDRADELRDLLAHYANVFAPDGCQPETDRPAAAEDPMPAAPPA